MLGPTGRRRLLPALGATVMLLAVGLGVRFLSGVPSYLDLVSSPAVTRLAHIDRAMPAGAELIASQGIIGRFGAGRPAYSYWADGRREDFPVHGRTIYFVFVPKQGIAPGNPLETSAAIHAVVRSLHAAPLSVGSGVYAYAWSPPAGTHRLLLP